MFSDIPRRLSSFDQMDFGLSTLAATMPSCEICSTSRGCLLISGTAGLRSCRGISSRTFAVPAPGRTPSRTFERRVGRIFHPARRHYPANPAPVEIDIEPINSHSILEQEPPAAPPAIVEQQPPEPAVEERAPALQHDFVGHTVTPEHRLIGLIVKHRVPAGDVNLEPEHFSDPDLRYVWERWVRLGSAGVAQLDMDAIRARRNSWALFTVWLIDVAAAPDPDDPIDPIREIATLAAQIRRRTEEPPPPPVAIDVVEILPPVPPAAPLEIVEEAPPSLTRPLIEIEQPPPEHPAPAAPAEIEAQASLPLDRASPADVEPRNLTAAIDLAGVGFAVFLCDQHKKPRGKWRDISTTDPETIRLWFQTWPDSIVGIDLAKSG